MGKFNSGYTFLRTKKDICNDYLDFLIKKKVIKPEEKESLLLNQDYVLELLLEKLYETEIYKGVEISTLNAFRHYIEFVLSKDVATGQKIWNKFVKEMFVSVERNKNCCIMASRSLGKSYFVYVLYTSFKMFLFPNTKILIVSNIPAQCVENLRILKNLIDTNELLYEKKAVWKGKDLKWTERQIEYNGGMLVTFSAGTSPKGQHVNYAFVDDILTDTSNYSFEEIENYIMGQVYPCVQRAKGRLVITGTPLSPTDTYHKLMNEKKDFGGKLITHGAISAYNFYSKAFPIMDEDGNPYMPEIYGKKEIEMIRSTMDDIKFEREYLLKCTDTSAILFPMNLIKKAMDDNYRTLIKGELGKYYVTGVDVATSGEASADYSAFITLELLETEEGLLKIVRHIVHTKGMAISALKDAEGNELEAGQIETIKEIYNDFNYCPVIVEVNNVGVSIIQGLIRQNVQVESFRTDKYNKENMIRYLISEMKNGNLIIPNDGSEEIKKLIKELNNFGIKRNKYGKERMEALSGHDDLVMALAIANYGTQKFGFGSSALAICQD